MKKLRSRAQLFFVRSAAVMPAVTAGKMPRHERTDGEQAQTYNKNAMHTLATFAALDLSFYTGKGFHLALSFCFNQCHSSSF